MTLSSVLSRIQYAGNGIATAFAFPYLFLADSHLRVVLTVDATGVDTLQVITTHYTVAGAGVPAGGTVTMITPPASGETLTILRIVPATQLVDYVANDNFPAETHEEALDKLTMLMQQLTDGVGRDLDRAIKYPETEPAGFTANLPAAVIRAGKVLAFDVITGDMDVTQEIGQWQGNWATATAFVKRDLFSNPVNSDLYITLQDHTSTNIAADVTAGDIALLIASTHSVAQAAAAASAAAALVSETNAAASEVAAAASATAIQALIGSIMWWTTATPPTGWLECDGSAINRTTFATLFAVIGTIYGIGDGSTTFNLPDLRGRFVRGFDNGAGVDPDAASRTDRGDGTTGDNVGTKQADEVTAHQHSHDNHDSASTFTTGGLGPQRWVADAIQDSLTTSTGGNETRPVNIQLMPIIRYQ